MMSKEMSIWKIFFCEVRECLRDYFAPLVSVVRWMRRYMRDRN
jgi:hypothetical protein